MKLSKSMVLLSFLAIVLTGCNGGGKKGGGGNKTTSKGDETVLPELELTDEQRQIYEQHYTNKTDCFGNDVEKYNILTLGGYSLIKEIHKYLIDQHTTYVKYNDINGGIYKNIDKAAGQDGKIELFYTGKLVTSYSSGSTAGKQNREHVWPCERSNLWYRKSDYWEYQIDTNGRYWGAGSDLYHVRPADAVVNTVRSNSRFYEFVDGDNLDRYTQGESGGLYDITVDDLSATKRVEVADAFKGDVARLLMYLYVHYTKTGYDVYYSNNPTNPSPVYNKDEAIPMGTGSDGKVHNSDVCGQLPLTDIIYYKDESKCIELIKRWNAVDAPSDTEKLRCDTIQSQYQGNRNPFVDFPQLIDRCF